MKQKLVTLFVNRKSRRRPGHNSGSAMDFVGPPDIEEHLNEYLEQNWRITQIHPLNASSSADGALAIVLLESP